MRLLLRFLWLASLTRAQLESSSIEIITITGSSANISGEAPAATVSSDFDASTIASASLTSTVSGSAGSLNATASTVSSEATYTQIVGGTRSSRILSGSATATTSTAAPPVNTQPCNNHPEFCHRKYSNITEVCAHNPPFVRQKNVASNQELTVTQQLDDGIRMLQGQAHNVNGTLFYCHTSCDLLNAGTVEDYLRTVSQWVARHPFDVITIIFGNANWQHTDDNGNRIVTARNFAEPIEASGLLQYIYQPPKTAMTFEDWPTLGELIISGKRVITFIDYNWDTNEVPYLLWEFYNMWETPFSPTREDFTCEIQRPEGLSENRSREMLYMANHNLNVQVSITGLNFLIPNTAELNETNGVNGSGSLGEMVNRCTGMWDRPPNFLLVDYYN
ncbi:PLC-like phosphodiesterase [Bimuria novae-zelandiae CBS 107.79]|uniref:PLC-like phosphodiesterase n=1 Tax=Bimuria novae-zelandiae CBS 107.79 TaxID=1447943 RepID=A0A6A5VH58_9PLEO|nr:PLC-like phosphodiesterase [Bimuria novae-zelandiae CBS 107.79]